MIGAFLFVGIPGIWLGISEWDDNRKWWKEHQQ